MKSGLFDLGGKVAIVTGGNGGIGLGMARGLSQVGAKVAIVGRNSAKSQAAAKNLSSETGNETVAFTTDVSKPDQCRVRGRRSDTVGPH